MVRLLRHRQTKEPDSARPHLTRRATPRLHLKIACQSPWFVNYSRAFRIKNVTLNLGKADRILRLVVGVTIGATGILISGHPSLGRLIGGLGALAILSAGCGT